MGDPLADLAGLEDCSCAACVMVLGKDWNFYNLCSECGCKRCPKGTNHLHECTRSNEPGQYGSQYGTPCKEQCCAEYRLAKRERCSHGGYMDDCNVGYDKS